MDPRSSLQHVFTSVVTEMFRKKLYSFFGELASATRGCSSLSVIPQYSRSSIFTTLPGNQLSSVYNRESRTNTAVLAWFVGLNAEVYLSFFNGVILARPNFGGGWSTSYTVVAATSNGAAIPAKHVGMDSHGLSMISESSLNMDSTFQLLTQQRTNFEVLGYAHSAQAAAFCCKLFLLCSG